MACVALVCTQVYSKGRRIANVSFTAQNFQQSYASAHLLFLIKQITVPTIGEDATNDLVRVASNYGCAHYSQAPPRLQAVCKQKQCNSIFSLPWIWSKVIRPPSFALYFNRSLFWTLFWEKKLMASTILTAMRNIALSHTLGNVVPFLPLEELPLIDVYWSWHCIKSNARRRLRRLNEYGKYEWLLPLAINWKLSPFKLMMMMVMLVLIWPSIRECVGKISNQFVHNIHHISRR